MSIASVRVSIASVCCKCLLRLDEAESEPHRTRKTKYKLKRINKYIDEDFMRPYRARIQKALVPEKPYCIAYLYCKSVLRMSIVSCIMYVSIVSVYCKCLWRVSIVSVYCKCLL